MEDSKSNASKNLTNPVTGTADSVASAMENIQSLGKHSDEMTQKNIIKQFMDTFSKMDQSKKKDLTNKMLQQKSLEILLTCLKRYSAEDLGKFLSKTGYENSALGSLLRLVHVITNVSPDVAAEFGPLGVSLISAFLKVLAPHVDKTNQEHNEEITGMIETCMGILHECAKIMSNTDHFRKTESRETLRNLMSATNSKIKIFAALILAYIADQPDENIIKNVVKHFEETVNDRKENHFSSLEIVEVLWHLIDTAGVQEVVKHGILPVLSKLLEQGSEQEKRVCEEIVVLIALDEKKLPKLVANEEIERKINDYKNLKNILDNWFSSRHMNSSISMASGVSQGKTTGQPETGKTSTESVSSSSKPSIQDNAPKSNTLPPKGPQHIMISYSWRAKKETVYRISEKLEESGHRVWIDIEDMKGNMFDAMSKAIENAIVVLICFSSEYKNSRNCKIEALYAFKLDKRCIFLRMEKGYNPDGWLGLLLSENLYYDFSSFSTDKEFEKEYEHLVKAIDNP